MDIIKKAKKIRSTAKRVSKKVQLEAESESKKEQQAQDAAHVWMALRGLRNSKDFVLTKAESDISGEIAKLEKYQGFERDKPRELQYLGTICLQTDISTTYLTFQEIVNSKNRLIAVEVHGSIHAAIKTFCRQLAVLIAKESWIE